MFETISQVEKSVRSDIIFIIVIHLLLLNLYALVYNISAAAKSQYFSTNTTILGVCI